MPIKKHLFPKKPCSDTCPIRRERMKTITKLEGDIVLLTKFDIPAPIASHS